MHGRVRRRGALAGVSLAAVGLAIGIWLVYVMTERGQLLDAAAYGGAFWAQIGPWPLVEAARAALVLPVAGLVLAGAVGWTWWRRSQRLALVVLGVAVGATISIQVLKRWVLPRPDMGFPPEPNSLPSGHTGAVALAGVAVVLAASERTRGPLAVAAAAATAAVGTASVVGHQHRPSDIVAAMVVVVAWTCAGIALAVPRTADQTADGRTSDRRTADRPGTSAGRGPSASVRALAVTGAVVAVPALLSAVVLLTASDRAVGGTETLVALIGGICAIVSASAVAFALVARSAPAGGRGPVRAAGTSGANTLGRRISTAALGAETTR